MTLSPGTYLRKRREALRLGVKQAAANLAASPWAVRRATPDEVNRLMHRINAAEADRQPFTVDQARLLGNVFSLDIGVYEKLLALHADPTNPDLPHPQVCRGCACSFMDACVTDRGACSWAEPDLCTACLRVLDLSTELGPGVHRLHVPHAPGPQARKGALGSSSRQAVAQLWRPSRVSAVAKPGGCPAPAPEAHKQGVPA